MDWLSLTRDLPYFCHFQSVRSSKKHEYRENEVGTQKIRMYWHHKYIFWQLSKNVRSIATLARPTAPTQLWRTKFWWISRISMTVNDFQWTDTGLPYFCHFQSVRSSKNHEYRENEVGTQKIRMYWHHKYIFWQLSKNFRSIATLARPTAPTQLWRTKFWWISRISMTVNDFQMDWHGIYLTFVIFSQSGQTKIMNTEKMKSGLKKIRMYWHHKYIFWQLSKKFRSIATLARPTAPTQLWRTKFWWISTVLSKILMDACVWTYYPADAAQRTGVLRLENHQT